MGSLFLFYYIWKMYSKKSYTLNEAIKKLEGYCAYQDRCHTEVNFKLKEMNMIPEVIDHIVVHLIQNNFLNEERFARSYARGKHNIKKWGRNRIIIELKYRKITAYNIQRAMEEIDSTDYLRTLDNLARKKLSAINESNIQKKRKKLADYLFYRGWESHLVYEKIAELIK